LFIFTKFLNHFNLIWKHMQIILQHPKDCSLYVSCLKWFSCKMVRITLNNVMYKYTTGRYVNTFVASQRVYGLCTSNFMNFFGIWVYCVPKEICIKSVCSFQVSLSLDDWTELRVQYQDACSFSICELPLQSKSYKNPVCNIKQTSTKVILQNFIRI
jgi:hypothetical protein